MCDDREHVRESTTARKKKAPGGQVTLPEPEKTRRRQLMAASPMSLYSPFLIWNSHMPPWMPMWSVAE